MTRSDLRFASSSCKDARRESTDRLSRLHTARCGYPHRGSGATRSRRGRGGGDPRPLAHDHERKRHMIASNNKKWWALALLSAVQFMVVLDIAIVNVALPSVQTDLGFSQENLQWVISAY